MNFRVSPGEDFPRGVGNVYLHKQGAGWLVNRLGGSHQLAEKAASGKLRHGQIRLDARNRRGGINLRHIDVDAQGVNGRHMKQFLGAAAASGTNELADIGIARRKHAVERRVNLLKGL